MDKTIRRAASAAEQKADEYRYWQSVTGEERIRAAWQLTQEAYHRKGLYEYGQELDRTLGPPRPLRPTSNSLGDETR